MKNKQVTYKIQNNDDWNNLQEQEVLVDINNDAYFGFRAMERNAIAITYDPNIIDSMIRLGKESRKFPKTIHNLILDIETLGFESSNSEESFLKHSTRVIEQILELNPDIKLDFTLNCNSLDYELILSTLYKIYVNKN